MRLTQDELKEYMVDAWDT